MTSVVVVAIVVVRPVAVAVACVDGAGAEEYLISTDLTSADLMD